MRVMADSLALIYLPEPFIFFPKHVKLRLGLGFYIFSPLLEWSDDMELLCFKTSYLFFTTSCYVTFDFNFSFMGRTALWGTTGALFLPSFFHSWLKRFLMMKFRARGLTGSSKCDVQLLWTILTSYQSQVVGL